MKRLQGIVIGSLITIIISGVIGYASSGLIEVLFDNIKIKVNGNDIKSDTEPFVYNNRTYVPLRAVAENMGADVYWDNTTNTVSIHDSHNKKNQNFYDSIYLLGTSTRLSEISDSFHHCRSILTYESRDTYVYNKWYESFKIARDSFYNMKSEYTIIANSIINSSTCSENIEVANKLLNSLTLLDENINLLSDLYVSFDYDKAVKFTDNWAAISQNNAETRSIIYEYINN